MNFDEPVLGILLGSHFEPLDWKMAGLGLANA